MNHDTDYFFYRNKIYDPEVESPNGMLVDADEYIEPENEKDDVAVISPDDGDMPGLPRADDCMPISSTSAPCGH